MDISTSTSSTSSSTSSTSVSTSSTSTSSTSTSTLPLMQTLVDDFDDNSIDTAKWAVNVDNATFTESSGKWNYSVAANSGGQVFIESMYTSGAYPTGTPKLYNFHESYAYVEVTSMATSYVYQDFALMVYDEGYNHQIAFEINSSSAGSLNAIYDGVNQGTITYSNTTHRFLRLREASSVIYWDTSSDGTNWTNRVSMARTHSFARASPAINFQTSSIPSVSWSASADNFNNTPGTTTSTSSSISTSSTSASTSISISTSSTSSSISTSSTSSSRSTSTSSTSQSTSISTSSTSTSISISTSSTSNSTSTSISTSTTVSLTTSTSSTSQSMSTSSTSRSISTSSTSTSRSTSTSISTSSTSTSTTVSYTTSTSSTSSSISTSTSISTSSTSISTSTSLSVSSTSTSISTSTTLLDFKTIPHVSIRHILAPRTRIRWRLK